MPRQEVVREIDIQNFDFSVLLFIFTISICSCMSEVSVEQEHAWHRRIEMHEILLIRTGLTLVYVRAAPALPPVVRFVPPSRGSPDEPRPAPDSAVSAACTT